VKAETVQLGDVCEINPATDRDLAADDVCSFVPMEAVDDVEARIARLAARPFREVSKGYTVFAENDVIIAKITPCMENGKCAIARGLRNGVGFGSTEFHVLRASKGVMPEWLHYFWLLPQTRQTAARNMTGSAGQKRVPTSFLESLAIPLPSLPEQRRIAAQLEQADRLRRTRRYALDLSDSFLPAAFLGTFGARFEQGPLARFGDLVEITGGGTPSRDCPDFFHGRIPWLTSKDMRGDYIWDTEEHITEEAVEKCATKLVPAKSILIVVKSKVLMHRLPVAVAMVPICHGQDVKSIQCSQALHHEFARFILKHHEARLLHFARGANTEGLTLPMLRELPVPHVGPEEQRHFADLVCGHERLRAVQRESLRQAEHLFQSLLHRAFADEMNGLLMARPAVE
jgi:type I restriction enzyme S subunit